MNKIIDELESNISKFDSITAMIYALEYLLRNNDIDNVLNLTSGLKDLFEQYISELKEIAGRLYENAK